MFVVNFKKKTALFYVYVCATYAYVCMYKHIFTHISDQIRNEVLSNWSCYR